MTFLKYSFPLTCLALCLLAISACKAKKIKTNAVPPQEKSAFYTFNAQRDSVSHKTTFTLTNITVADAKIKYTIDAGKAKDASYLRIEIQSKTKVVQAFTEHPLYKRVEVFSESGQIESKLISLPQSDFVLRVPYFEEYKKIKIVEVINFKEQSPVILKHEN